ncbi:hypothetical protein [Massilia sp. LC238]|uniref:hypothetical protein n=1 Tax=Massilia sp. LC238 TaxID=1502852 RepID=UPI0004E3D043|nr:hypothetical protein [Massilia sp. LC238]KFC61943.1 hypothetical protein FG94_04983 [Massilia sp. LC238]
MYDNPNRLKSAEAGRDTTEIERCMKRANDVLERLHSHVNALEDRLRPVMRATGAGSNGGVTGVPQEALSPLGDAIRGFESRTDSACDRLEALLNGLAL